MKNFSLILPGLVLLIVSFFIQCQNKKDKENNGPNVLMIVLDDMNGGAIKDNHPLIQAPYIDKLKGEAINFVNAACNAPVCNPSRSSFFSGILPHKTGAYTNGSDGWNRSELLRTIRSIPEHFKDNGYTTWGRGKIFHNPMDSVREHAMWDNRPIFKGGFGPFPEREYWYGGNQFRAIKAWEDPDTDFPDVKNADAAIDFIKGEHDKPFFLYYGLWRPHNPYTAPKRFFDLYNEEDFKLPDGYKPDDLEDVPNLGRMLLDSLSNYRSEEDRNDIKWRKFLYAYAANYSFADWNVGRVIEALDQSNYADNTIVIVFSDNGFHNGEKLRWGKGTLWEKADYVPFIVRTPEARGAVSYATVSLVDIYPTLVEYCGLRQPEHHLDGKSIVPLLNNPDIPWDRPSFTSYGVGYSSVRNEEYRYLRYPDGSEELYNLIEDPYEWDNLALKEDSKVIIKELSKHIPAKWAPSLGGRLEVPRKGKDVMRKSTKWDNSKPTS